MNLSPLLQNTAVLSSAILITLVGMMFHIHFVKVDHESLLVIGSLGIQVSSCYASGRETTTFIEMSKIKDIVINEAIYMVNLCYPYYSYYSYVSLCLSVGWYLIFNFSIRSSTTFVCCWRTLPSLKQCQVLCHCFRWVWMQNVHIPHKAACFLTSYYVHSCIKAFNIHCVIHSF